MDRGMRAAAAACLLAVTGSSAYGFVVDDIRLEGLQRVSTSLVNSALPIVTGDDASREDISQAVRALYDTGQFQNIEVYREGRVLVFRLSERPAVSSIELTGNELVQSEDLLDGLRRQGMYVGSVFQRATLDQLKVEMKRQYTALGRYSATINVKAEPLPRNRVAIHIDIDEGDVATIAGINIVGNRAFSEETLLQFFDQQKTNFWSWFSSRDQYARERLSGDLERLRSFYLDKGYLDFNFNGTQVSITPDKRAVYITIQIEEGGVYTIGDVKLAGDFIVPEAQLRPLLLVQKDQTYSQNLVTLTEEVIAIQLGNEGYTFAQVTGRPQLNPETLTADVTFLVQPREQMYVRDIRFEGHYKTQDEVLRRQMRQMERSVASTQKLKQSKKRLEQLGYLKTVSMDYDNPGGDSDQLDVIYTIEEAPSGSLGASVGFQQGSGLIFGANVSQTNFLGTGNRVSFNINRSDVRQSYSFSYLNPFYTLDGVSRGFNVYLRETDFSEVDNISGYTTDKLGGDVTFGYPINEDTYLNFSGGYERTRVYGSRFSSDEVRELIEYDNNVGGNHDEAFDAYVGSLRWVYSTLNRGFLPDDGGRSRVAFEVALPGSDLAFYKLTYNGEVYFPIAQNWTLRLRTELAYGDGYGSEDDLPVYENFFAGGLGSVRGYRSRSLGPRETISGVNDPDPDAAGGNLLTEGAVELIVPTPFVDDQRMFRTALFVDAGNVFDTQLDDIDGNEIEWSALRMSAGVSFSWISAIGPLTFSLAKPFNYDDDVDDLETFQFSLGQTF